MSKDKEIAIAQDNFLAPLTDKNEWGPPPELSAKDIIIPRILLMQGQSDLVLASGAAFGDFRDSVSGELLGSPKQALDIIPFAMKKSIVVSDYDAKKKDYVYRETIDSNPENDRLPYEEDGVKRQHQMRFWVLLPKEIAEGGAIPKVITIKGMSNQAGKVIATQMYAINASANPWLPPCAYTMTLTPKIDKNDKGTFAIIEAKRGRKSSPEEITRAFEWYKQIQAASEVIKVDEEVIDTFEPVPVAQKPQGNLKDPKGF